MAELTHNQITEIIEAAVRAGLAQPARRDLLFAGIDPFFWQSIAQLPSPVEQLRADLVALQQAAVDGQPERLARWLENAAQMTHPRVQSQLFAAMRRHVGGGHEAAVGLGTPVTGQLVKGTTSESLTSSDASQVPLFTWVHVSDIHFSHGDAHEQWDQELVLDRIVRDFRQFEAEGIPAPEKVFITGDLAYSGGANKNLAEGQSEYALTRGWLETVVSGLGLQRRDIYMVPGNHDVNWGADKDRNTLRMVQSIREGQERLDGALGNKEDRQRLFDRHGPYLEFANAFASPCAAPFWHEEFVSRGLKVRLVGLDTALVAKSGDMGKLFLGLEQWTTAVRGLDEDTLVIVLSHHPLRQGWLGDQAEMRRWIRRDGHIHLCGHIHEGETAEGWAGGGQGHVEIIAGAAHAPEEERIFGHGYNVAAIYAGSDGQLELRVWPRTWSEKNKEFRRDVDNTLRGKAYARHRLDLRAP